MSNNNNLKAINRGLTVDLLDQQKAKTLIKKFEQARNEATKQDLSLQLRAAKS